MPLNFNVDPYYDDFDPAKNFHRILFKPGYAVQARELTQAQTILQDQITKFADNIFKQNSPVTGGQVTTNLNVNYIKLQSTYQNAAIDITKFNGLLVTNALGTVIARVLAVAAATGTGGVGDPPTLVVSYQSGVQFNDNDVIYDTASNLAAQALSTGSTGSSSIASIAQGVFYVNGNFVQVSPSTTILDKYDSTPSLRIGLTITETIIDYVSDASLLDPAVGASNFQAPGADRYEIALTLSTRPLAFGDDKDFIELVRVENGQISRMVSGSVYNVIDDYFAKRDYETNGNYIVNDFKLTPKTNTDPDKYTMSIGKGIAYVNGYRVENPTNFDIVSNRARTTNSLTNSPIFIDYGSYFYVSSVAGANGYFFDTTTTQAVDFHCVDKANVIFTTAATYQSTLVGTGYIRSLVFDHDLSDTDSSTYVYKAYVHALQNASLSNTVVSATSTTVTLQNSFSAVDNAYKGVQVSIVSGTGKGQLNTIASYVGSTKVATMQFNWTIVPDSTSVIALNFAIGNIQTIMDVNATSYPATLYASAAINPEGKTGGVASGSTQLINPNTPELIFPIGNPYVSLQSNASYTTQQLFRNVSFTTSGGSVTAQLNYEGDYTNVIRHFGTPLSTLPASLVRQNYVIVVTNKGTNSTINVGDLLTWNPTARTVTLDTDASIATFSASDLSPFTADILATVFVENADNIGHVLKGKNLIQANTQVVVGNTSPVVTQVNINTFVDNTNLTSTGQIFINHAGLVPAGQKQSLYLSDVKSIVKIIDTKDPAVPATVAMLTNPTYDVTANYVFDNGQRDSHYDHASITLRPGFNNPIGNLLVLLNYYQHTGGDGYFNIMSYIHTGVSSLPEQYTQIPTYVSKHGTHYNLRDCDDFRPARLNAQSAFVYRYSNVSDTKHGVYLPVDLSTFESNYSYYLGRKDKLILSKDNSFQIIEGAPSTTPLFPSEPDASLVLANITHNPYTGYIPTEAPTGTLPDLSIEKVKHKRYTMEDIATIENRVNQVEYYTSLNLLEQSTSALQISDAYGLNRFKNGILVDDFSSYASADTTNTDYKATINRRTRQLTATQNVQNFPLKSIDVAYNMGALSSSALNSLSYSINLDGYVNYYGLPYTTANVATQKFASRTVNVNPFSFPISEGVVALSPNVDTWVDTQRAPSLLITDPNLQIYQANTSGSVNILSAGDWKTISSTSYSSYSFVPGRLTTTTYTSSTQQQTNIVGPYDSLGSTYAINNGYITDISVLPYIRSQQVVIRAKGLLYNTNLNTTFDTTPTNVYVRKGNVIELTNVIGSFAEDDVLGYYTGGVFTPTGRVLGVYNYPNTSNTRLYVAADANTKTYSTTGVIGNAQFNTSGLYQSNTAHGTITLTKHFGGRVANANSSSVIQLSVLSNTTTDYYTGNTIYFNAGSAVGQTATITKYYGANQVAILSNSVTVANADIYSIGTFSSDETGSFYGIFNVPGSTFHTGQRIFRVDNSINNNPGSATTHAEGTFFAEGLQTTQQGVQFAASPSAAAGVFTQTNTVAKSSTVTTSQPWDPVAQTFMFDNANYPNGLFLNSIKLFFASKPTTSNDPITLSILGTTNGYPNGQTIDHSIVTLTPDMVNVSAAPQYLDSTAYTEFMFNVPVYIQPGTLYAFMLKSKSNQYTLWSASNGDTALSSSVKNLPTDPTPSAVTKIGSAPYVGALFISQNSQTWSADQNQDLMFVIDRCVFNTGVSPSIHHVVPNKLPQRTVVEQSIDYFLNANNVTSLPFVTNKDVLVDAFNVTTTDMTPTTTSVQYSYQATLASNDSATAITNIVPGKYGTTTNDDIYLNDGQGERILLANSSSSFSLYSQLSSNDDAVSPFVSDAGLSVYAIEWNINNVPLSNSNITVVNGGSGYSNNQSGNVTVAFSAPTGMNGSQAYGVANVANGIITNVYVTTPGSGYIITPTVTISDANTTPGTGAVVVVTGETSSSGGNATAKYVTKKVVLDAGYDSGDLNVYLTAYRPVNTDILVYYKILNRADTQTFESGNWQLMNKIKNSDSSYSQTRNDLHEYTFAPGTGGVDQGYVTYTSTNGQTYTTFSQFAIKVVLVTSDNTFVPFLTDLRAIALPSNTNSTV